MTMEAIESYRGHRGTRGSVALRLSIVAGLTVAVAGGLAVALVLLPKEVHDTAGRVWVSVGLFGITVACLGGILAYSARTLSPKRGRNNDEIERDAQLLASMEVLLSERRGVRPTRVPPRALRYMDQYDAARYAVEWAAHLRELVEEDEYEQAMRDRRRLTFLAIRMAIALRVRRFFSRAHS
jgi:hypothetical protein